MFAAWADAGVSRTMDYEGMRMKIAEKLVHGDGIENFLADGKNHDKMTAHFHDRGQVMNQIAALAESENFHKFIGEACENCVDEHAKFIKMQMILKLPGVKAREIFARYEANPTKDRLMKGQNVNAQVVKLEQVPAKEQNINVIV